jgi:hypothetical protein
MNRHYIARRTISETIYQKHNPAGDPFALKPITTLTDPGLLRIFILFLTELCVVKGKDLHFGLQFFIKYFSARCSQLLDT